MTAGDIRRLVVFDMDGTLVDSQGHIQAAMRQAFLEEGLTPPEPDAIRGIIGRSLPLALAELCPDCDRAALDRLVRAYHARFGAIARDRGGTAAPLFPGACELLQALAARDGVDLAVATGKSRRGLSQVMEMHGLAGLFATLQVADDHPSKPDPAMLHAALGATGIEAANAVMIGDTTYDVEMGRAAGLATIGVAWGYHPAASLRQAGADRIVAEMEALGDAALGLLEIGDG